MITIKEKKELKSFWKNDTAWDTTRKTSKDIYFLGVRIYSRSEDFKCDWIEPSISKNIGFQK
jgi:hypothetical protein